MSFVALLKMFLEDPSTALIVEDITHTVTKRGTFIIGHTDAIVTIEEFRTLFIHENIKLVSDVWYPIIDMVVGGYLENDPPWAD